MQKDVFLLSIKLNLHKLLSVIAHLSNTYSNFQNCTCHNSQFLHTSFFLWISLTDFFLGGGGASFNNLRGNVAAIQISKGMACVLILRMAPFAMEKVKADIRCNSIETATHFQFHFLEPSPVMTQALILFLSNSTGNRYSAANTSGHHGL